MTGCRDHRPDASGVCPWCAPPLTEAERDALIDQWREARRRDTAAVMYLPPPDPHRPPVAVEILAAIGLLAVVCGPCVVLVLAVLGWFG